MFIWTVLRARLQDRHFTNKETESQTRQGGSWFFQQIFPPFLAPLLSPCYTQARPWLCVKWKETLYIEFPRHPGSLFSSGDGGAVPPNTPFPRQFTLDMLSWHEAKAAWWLGTPPSALYKLDCELLHILMEGAWAGDLDVYGALSDGNTACQCSGSPLQMASLPEWRRPTDSPCEQKPEMLFYHVASSCRPISHFIFQFSLFLK